MKINIISVIPICIRSVLIAACKASQTSARLLKTGTAADCSKSVSGCTPSRRSDPNHTAQVVPISWAKSILQAAASWVERPATKSPISNLWTPIEWRRRRASSSRLPHSSPFPMCAASSFPRAAATVFTSAGEAWSGAPYRPGWPLLSLVWANPTTRGIDCWVPCSWGFFDVRNQIQIFSYFRTGTLILSFFGV
jgi:hypothetical protein